MADVLDGDDDWDAAQEGAELIAEGDLEAAVAYLEGLLQRCPDNPYAHHFLGTARFEQADYVRALRAYLDALTHAPDYLGAMVATGQTLRMLGRYPEAIRMGHQVLARMPDDADALFLLGACHFARGDEDAARRFLERFLETTPELEAALEAQGMLQVLAGEIIEDDPPQDVN